jgi:hypothetical protein
VKFKGHSNPQRYTAETNQETSRGQGTLQLRVPSANENLVKHINKAFDDLELRKRT